MAPDDHILGQMPSGAQPSVLIVEDDRSLGALYSAYLKSASIPSVCAESVGEAIEILETQRPAVILLDLILPDRDGFALLAHIRDKGLPINVIVVSNDASVDRAVEAMRLGAYDFLVKPFEQDRLVGAVKNALAQVDLTQSVSDISARVHSPMARHGFIGQAPALHSVAEAIDRVSQSMVPVFVTGEGGTGKEICARAIHDAGMRAQKPFVAASCRTIGADGLSIESIASLVQRADGGTLFLNDVGELALGPQTDLFHYLQTGSVVRSGVEKPERADVRLISANRTDLIKAVQAGYFHEDLYYRLHVVPMELPALRDRGEDVCLLAEYFLERFSEQEGKQFSRLSEPVTEVLMTYSWPGNVRELHNLMRLLVIMNDGEEITLPMLPTSFQALVRTQSERDVRDTHVDGADIQGSRRGLRSSARLFVGQSLAVIERHAIEATIEACDGNIPRAARMLKVSPSTLYRKLEAWKRKAGLNN